MIFKEIHTPTDKWRFLSRYLKEKRIFFPFVKNRLIYANSLKHTPFICPYDISVDALILNACSSFGWGGSKEGSVFWGKINIDYTSFIRWNTIKVGKHIGIEETAFIK